MTTIPAWFPYTTHWILARDSVVGWGTMLQAGRSRVRFPMRSLDFSITYSFQPHYGPGIDSASNRNEYQESSWGWSVAGAWGWQPHLHLWADCQENVGASTSHNLWAFTDCYRDSFTFLPLWISYFYPLYILTYEYNTFLLSTHFFCSENGGSGFRRNAGNHLQNYAASHCRRAQY
jgi:hypothetical protein